MKTKIAQIIIALLFLVISPQISSAEINKDVLIQWIRASFDVAEISDQALDDLLNQPALVTMNAYEPLPESFYTVFGAIFAAESIGTKLGNNDYLGAMSEAESLVLASTLSESFASSLYSTYSVASTTASLVELYLHCFADQLVANALQDQIKLYIKARTMGYSHEFILSGQDDDTVFFMPNGWLLMVDYERANLNPTFGDLTSAQVFTGNALLAYQASLAAPEVAKEKQEVGAIFTSLIKPGIAITPAYPTAPADVQFEVSGRMIEAMHIVSYSWNFGDSTTATGNAVMHYYKTPGTYQVVLTLTDNGGTEHVYNKSVKIDKPPVHIDFPDGCTSSTRQFSTASSSHIAEYTWNFGDGTPEVSGRVKTHDYVNRQSYVVTLKVKLDDNTILQNTGYVFTQNGERSVASHTISGLEEWCGASTYIVEGSLYVAAGATLKIAPNTLVKLKPGAGINVSGTLIADQVTFTWATEGSPWKGIEFWDAGASGSKLTNCIIEHGSACTTVASGTTLYHGLISVFKGAAPEIKNCVITGSGSSTGIWVGGLGAAPIITGNTISGFATGIYVGDNYWVSPGLATANVINNTISNNSFGLDISGSAGGTYKFNRFTSNGTGVQVYYTSASVPVINDNSFSASSSYDISTRGTLPAGATVTWQGGNISYYNSNGMPTVSAGAKLIIQPGAIIKFAAGWGAPVYGTLIADQVTFTWATVGSPWKGIEFWDAGASGSKLTNCIIEHGSACTTVASGTTLYHGLISAFKGAAPEIKTCVITGSGSSTGIWVGGSGAAPVITENTISGFATGIYVGDNYWVSPGQAIGNVLDNTISNNTLGLNIAGTAGGGTYRFNKFSNNGTGVQVNYTATNVPVVDDNNFSTSGSYDFSMSGTIPTGTSVTWQGGNLSYYNSNGLPGIPSGAKLTIKPGAIIKFAPGRGVSVSGTLIADQVTFTWATEGSVWKGIEFWNAGSSGSRLTHCIIEHGSACTTVASGTTLYHGWISVFKGAAPEIKNCVITGNGSSTGIWVGGLGAAPIITGNTISGFATGIYVGDNYWVSPGLATADVQFNVIKNNSVGIDLSNICTGGTYINNAIMSNSSFGFRYSGSSIINAANNYWGAESGPLDDSNDTSSGGWYNPTGTGNKVSNKVKYLPWGATNLSLDSPDEDNDGITDWLEVKFGLNPNSLDGSSKDDDHDGYSNYQECVNWVKGELDQAGQEFNPTSVNSPNGTGYLSLGSVMHILQILTGQSPSEPEATVLDVNADKKMGMEEAINALKQLSTN